MIRKTLTAFGLYMLVQFSSQADESFSAVNLGYFNELAKNGYDVMTYWKSGNPKTGDPQILNRYKNADWVFISTQNRDLFASNPEHYAPQYGGYCTFAASQGQVADVNPFAWRISNDPLYLNCSHRVRRIWSNNIDANVASADRLWPEILTTKKPSVFLCRR